MQPADNEYFTPYRAGIFAHLIYHKQLIHKGLHFQPEIKGILLFNNRSDSEFTRIQLISIQRLRTYTLAVRYPFTVWSDYLVCIFSSGKFRACTSDAPVLSADPWALTYYCLCHTIPEDKVDAGPSMTGPISCTILNSQKSVSPATVIKNASSPSVMRSYV